MTQAINGMKGCPTCESTKSVSDFGKNRSTRDGFSNECRQCDHDRKKRERSREAAAKPVGPSFDLEGETWRPIPCFSGYEISTEGRVRSTRKDCAGITRQRLLKPQNTSNGYVHYILIKDGKMFTRTGQRLMKAAFDIPGSGNQINHIDGDKRNNSLSNLEMVTAAENIRHGCNLGLIRGNCLTNEQVADIKKRYIKGATSYRALAEEYGVAVSTICNIILGKTRQMSN